MSANHAPGCPAIADTRDGCACLLRPVAAQGGHDPLCPIGQHPTRFDSCICDRLRACEARVQNEYRQQHDGISERYFQQIRNDALDAAREAVAALPWEVAISFGPIDCDYSCEEGPCTCSGVMRPEAWRTGPDEVVAAIRAIAALKEQT